MATNNHLIVGTAGGTVLSVIANIHSADVVSTVLLAVVGAVVSFSISLLLKWIIKKRKK